MLRAIPANVGILGGGTAGYFTALALRRAFPELSITLIESSKIPIIGVGEATTPPLVAFLHNFLELDVHELYREVIPTWKLGIHFQWGRRGHFNYPFSTGDLTDSHAHDGYIERASLGSLLMTAKRVPMFHTTGEVASGLKSVRFAYHLDNRRFVRYLQKSAARRNIQHLDAVIASAVPRAGANGEPEIDHLITDTGEKLSFDFYIDCTGFGTLLMGKQLESPFHSYDSSLYCDSAVVADVPHNGTIKPYTTAETMDSGWCWNIPMVEEDHRGYVYSSAFISKEDAVREMRAKNPGMADPWFVKFRSGRHEHFWRGNVAAVGNAYGFVEPLESTALHMVIIEITRLLRMLDTNHQGTVEQDRAAVNKLIGAHWDYLRWFLALHYRFNTRLDTPFWRHCREEVNISGLAELVEEFRRNGPLSSRGAVRPPDSIFAGNSIDVMLLGQDVPTVAGTPTVDRATWEQSCQRRAELLADSLTLKEALDVIKQRPEILDELIHDADSWCPELARDIAPGVVARS